MKSKHTLSMLFIMLLFIQSTYSQVGKDLVELDEIVLSIPFGQTLGKSVIKVDKINRLNIEYPKELDNLFFMLDTIDDIKIEKGLIVNTLTVVFKNDHSISFNCWGGTKLKNDILEARELNK